MRVSPAMTVPSLAVPQVIRDSPLMKAGGCAIHGHFPGPAGCAKLLEEARQSLRGAVVSTVATSNGEEVRGGNPARRFISASGGEVQQTMYRDPEWAGFLGTICNVPVRPTGGKGTYTYYARPGDHLALHRDVESCDITVITCLLDRRKDGSTGGSTCFYPTRQHEPLSRIRATPGEGAVRVHLPVGRTMVMFGGLIPHLIEPLNPGELRIVSILCFRACID